MKTTQLFIHTEFGLNIDQIYVGRLSMLSFNEPIISFVDVRKSLKICLQDTNE